MRPIKKDQKSLIMRDLKRFLLGVFGGGIIIVFMALIIGGSAHAQLNGLWKIPYQPSMVTFTPETELAVVGSSIVANGGVDTTHFIAHWWERCGVGSITTVVVTQGNESNWTCELLDEWTNLGDGTCTSETCPGLDFVYDNATGTLGTLRLNMNDATGGNNHSFQAKLNNFHPPINAGLHEFLWVGDMGFTQGNKRNAFYMDRVKQVLTSQAEVGTVGSFNVAVNSALGFGINGHTNSGITSGAFDIADFFLDTHTTSFTGCAAIIDASSNVCTALVNAWTNNGTTFTNPGRNGASIYGSQPDLFFTGAKGPFSTNVGAATATFALSNPVSGSSATPLIVSAAYGPVGAPTTRPYFKWVSGGHLTGISSSTASLTPSNRGNPIVQGDFLLFCMVLADTSTAVNRLIVTPSGYAVVPTTTITYPLETTGTHPGNYDCTYKIADSGDVTAAGSDWGTPPTYTWTTNANTLRSATYELYDYGGANVSTPIQVADGQKFASTSTSSVAPTVTPTGIPTTLITVNQFWQNQINVQPDTSEDLRFKLSQGVSNTSFSMASDKALSTTSATGSITTSQSAAEASVAVNIVLTQ